MIISPGMRCEQAIIELYLPSSMYKTGRVTLEHIPIYATANFTQLLAIIPIHDAKPSCNHELGQDETDKLGANCQNELERMSKCLSKIVFSVKCIFFVKWFW